jgi:small subunit ribosomal protein S5
MFLSRYCQFYGRFRRSSSQQIVPSRRYSTLRSTAITSTKNSKKIPIAPQIICSQRKLSCFNKLKEPQFAMTTVATFSSATNSSEKKDQYAQKSSTSDNTSSKNDQKQSKQGVSDSTLDFILHNLNEISLDKKDFKDYEEELDQSMGADSEEAEEKHVDLMNIPLAGQSYPINEVIKVWRHTKVMPGVRIHTFAALVVLGTGAGSAGLGYGKGNTPARAIERATRDAQRSMLSIHMYRDCALTKDLIAKYKRSKVIIKAVRPGYGLRGSYEMRTIMQAFGIKDASIRCVGSRRNKVTLYRAIWRALAIKGIPLPEDIARATGKKLFNKAKAWYHRGE